MIHSFSFSDVYYILRAVQWTLLLSIVAFAGGAVLGALTATARWGGRRIVAGFGWGYVRLFQGTPLLMQLFIAFFGFGLAGIDVTPLVAASAALTLHAGAYLGEIWYGALRSVPIGQSEAAKNLGLRFSDRLVSIIVPQALRIAMPPTTGFLVQLIKGTSLTAIIGFVEITRAGQIVNNSTFAPAASFSIVALIYFALCFPLSMLARKLEKKL